ncbi:hypothetical protein PENTCL1PPCAC_4798 [Pristionchus entomophagus]|uniref:RNase H type-1 domain-containing protein n=1 Tax=Pristionchus entomophagus TaxID=358040 RepID=A0AAV5SHS6_9BILA|nr:hypothetical protein PENTCL1PPCAC_4798 [Pristionchus entomophagus]
MDNSFRETQEKFAKTLGEWQLASHLMYKKIVERMKEMEVIFEYRSHCMEDGKNNEVFKLLKEEKLKQFPNFVPISAPFSKSDWIITPIGALPLEGRTIPTVYVAGSLDGKGGGSYASLWVPESIEHLEISQRPVDLKKRLDFAYVFQFVTEVVAIYLAIKEAQLFNLPEIRVVTDSFFFMDRFKRDWITLDGRRVAHHGLYLKMKARMESIQVHFEGAKLTEENGDELLVKVHEMAKESNDKYMEVPVTNRE